MDKLKSKLIIDNKTDLSIKHVTRRVHQQLGDAERVANAIQDDNVLVCAQGPTQLRFTFHENPKSVRVEVNEFFSYMEEKND
jgi:hypothetical protein